MSKISVVVNTRNEEKNLLQALASVRDLASEIIVVDMKSTDGTREVAQKHGAKVYEHPYTGYVEPARNFAIEKATGDWILVLDADEEIPVSLSHKLKELASTGEYSFFRLPRKNIIFGLWIRHSRWWPDYNIRFFKKEAVSWSEVIHSVPMTRGEGLDLPAQESFAIVHHNYQTITQYLARMDRYTTIRALTLAKDEYKFSWRDLFEKPASEFLSRFFAAEGYKDGLHGLAVCALQAFSEFVLYLKVWENEKFKIEELPKQELENEFSKLESELDHWLVSSHFRIPSPITGIFQKIKKTLPK